MDRTPAVSSPPAAGWLARGALVFAVWTLLALLSTTQTALELIHRGAPVAWGPLLVRRLVDWYTCAIFLPPHWWLARRFPLERETWPRALAIHFAASVACVLIKYPLYLPLARLTRGPDTTLGGLFAGDGLNELMLFWAIIGIIHAIEFARRYQEGRTTAARLEAELASAQLEALAAQLRPHFLFNTLGAISELVHRDPDAADRMLTQLSELLRETLDRSGGHDGTLAEEMGLVCRYLDIMRTRVGPRLTVELDVPDEASDAQVPIFLLQPLIENALEHGVARRRGPARIRIGAAVLDGDGTRRLRLSVRDDGPGLGPAMGTGIGLANTRRRLARRYGSEHALVLTDCPDGGTEAAITIPYTSLAAVAG
jgi:signal transduction histidine kinase